MKPEENRKLWGAIQRKEQARLRDLDQLKRFMKDAGEDRKSPKGLLKLSLYARGIRASEAADILGVRRAIIDSWTEYLLTRKLIDLESLKHTNPLIKPAKSVILKFSRQQMSQQASAADISNIRQQNQIDTLPSKENLPATASFGTASDAPNTQAEESDRPEAQVQTPEVEFRPEEGVTYLVIEDSPQESVRIFIKEIRDGLKGLYITRANPKQVRRQYYLANTKVVWLTSVQSSEEAETISGIQDMSITVGKFIDENQKSVILLDGLEYMIINNGFQVVLRLIQQLRDKVSASQSRMIIPLSQEAVDGRQLSLLERDCQIIS